MDVLVALQQRVSCGRLLGPAPDAAQREILFAAALRAPDHMQLRPWRFLTVEDQARNALGELFAKALQARQADAPAQTLDKVRNAPLRAPLLVVVIACLQAQPKVPEQEQLLSAACAAHGLLLAAHGLGLGGIWRTGDTAYDPLVAEGLGLAANERIVGFLYLGNLEGPLRSPAALPVGQFVQPWTGCGG